MFKQLTDTRVLVGEFVDNETYLSCYKPPDLKSLEQLPFISNAAVYPTKVKISPDHQQAMQALQPQQKTIGILLHEGVHGGAQKVIEQISSLTKSVVQAKDAEAILMTVDLKNVTPNFIAGCSAIYWNRPSCHGPEYSG